MWSNGTSSGSRYSRKQYSNGPLLFHHFKDLRQRSQKRRAGKYGGQSICQIFSRTFSPLEERASVILRKGSIARGEGSAVRHSTQWQISAVVMSKGISRSSGRARLSPDPFDAIICAAVIALSVSRPRIDTSSRANPAMCFIDRLFDGRKDIFQVCSHRFNRVAENVVPSLNRARSTAEPSLLGR